MGKSNKVTALNDPTLNAVSIWSCIGGGLQSEGKEQRRFAAQLHGCKPGPPLGFEEVSLEILGGQAGPLFSRLNPKVAEIVWEHHPLSPLGQQISCSFSLHILFMQIPCNFTPLFPARLANDPSDSSL